jgi:acyl carrier protein
MDDQIRAVLGQYGQLLVDLDGLDDAADLFGVGLTSHGNVSVMIALEEVFGVEFPEHMLRKSTFESIASIRAALVELSAAGVP